MLITCVIRVSVQHTTTLQARIEHIALQTKRMTGEEFKLLKEGYQNSSQNLKDYLAEKRIAVAHYYYWKKKFDVENKALESAAQFVNITSKINPNLSDTELEVRYKMVLK